MTARAGVFALGGFHRLSIGKKDCATSGPWGCAVRGSNLFAMSETPRTHRTDQNDVNASLEIGAPPDRVWRCLVDPAELVRWFPLEAEVDPQVGGKLAMGWSRQGFRGEATITVIEPNQRLEMAAEMPLGGNLRNLVQDFRLENSAGGGTALQLTHSGFGSGPEAEAFSRSVERGWAFELFGLQHYLNHHDGVDRQVVFAQIDLDGTREEVWATLLGDNGPFVEGAPAQGELVNIALTSEYFDAKVVELWPGEGLTGVVEDLNQAYFRILVDPTPESTGQMRMTLWLSAYGLTKARLDELEQAFEGGLFAMS